MKFVKPLLRILLVIVVVVGVVFAITQRAHQTCNEIDIEIAYEGENLPVTEAEIAETIQKADVALGKQVKEIDLKAVHNAIANNALIRSIDHIGFRGSNLVVKLTLEEILMQVFCANEQHYFITTNGKVLPYTERIKERLIIVNGESLPTQKKASIQKGTLQSIFAMAKYITQTSDREAQYRQIHLNSKKQIELVPTIGNYTILFGDTSRMEEKFAALDHFFQQVTTTDRGDAYKHLDVRFKNKIIAS